MIQIKHPNPEVIEDTLGRVLNIASVIAGYGSLPTDLERIEPEQRGRYWWRDGNRYHLFSCNNDAWAWLEERGEDYVNMSFRFRYSVTLTETLEAVLAARFREVTILAD